MMPVKLQQLIDISRRYGVDNRYVIAGGGNASFKTADRLWVKASGHALGTIDENGFAMLDRALLAIVAEKTYSADPAIREEQVKNDLAAANLTPDRRPSVETSMHDAISAPFVVHLHPTVVCAMMSSSRAEEFTRDIFGAAALYIPYTDPGYLLFKRVEEGIAAHRAAHGAEPGIILLQNHGIFVSGDTPEEIARIYDRVMNAIGGRVTEPLPDEGSRPESPSACGIAAALETAFDGKTVRVTRSALTDHYTANPVAFRDVSRPFTPDEIVYCKSSYIYAEDPAPEPLVSKIALYRAVTGCVPKVILIRDVGLAAFGDTESEAKIVSEVYTDLMKIAWLSRSFGGPHPMNDAQIDFIDNWEVENYRRSVGTKKQR